MQTHNLGYPRIGKKRELKKACEQYWSGKIIQKELLDVSRRIINENLKLQQEAGIDLIAVNDFSFYDHVLDMTLTLGAIPQRYHDVILNKANNELDLYFAMARGYQKDDLDITAMEMTKWFDTNYHYIVPEFSKGQSFKLFSNKIINEFIGARQIGINAKPVILGPVSYLLLGKEKEEGFEKLDLIDNLLPVYLEILKSLQSHGAEYIQIDEPFLVLDLTDKAKEAYTAVYAKIQKELPNLKIILTTYFEGLEDNLPLALSLPVDTLHVDLVRKPEQLESILAAIPENLKLSLGVVDGRNIWKNDFESSLQFIRKAKEQLGEERILIAPSSSLLHVPYDLDLETKEESLPAEIKQWMAYAKQKIKEVALLRDLSSENPSAESLVAFGENKKAIENKRISTLIHDAKVQQQMDALDAVPVSRQSAFVQRKVQQQEILKLPLFPTTTIGSFPQTKEVRSWRAQFKKGEISAERYTDLLKEETKNTIQRQEKIGIDVLVHGEFERNDMVEYFGEQLKGFAFTENGWVQSYGSRCVKPPVIYGDVSRPEPLTVFWSQYAQSLTSKWVKGMLTGPVTILQWSFVRNDQSRKDTANQIALAIRDEVLDLEKAGIRIIQIDEPAIREGLPLRKKDAAAYLKWAVLAFRISASSVKDDTQIHTHMCYSEFNDIINHIADMDADVITIECSRSQMELLDAFADFEYPNDIGPGVYDIHAPRVPSKEEMVKLLEKAAKVIPSSQLWVNPDCGLKTRGWDETEKALIEMVNAAKEMQKEFASIV
ncbi:5-methyltetrahydropteroyltriglutamate--homocysteine S-methyltransferase [Elizabethkingia anophelis]|uniref:5-methyltetrahydropteroyltriglutamate--homocysteine methyltransferase n=1 Tax=Elizabethkingia anophelis NUHP1 TaxID=1338011 RepID=A0A077EB69_9FLAO|nr:5-methyltetrahydropteroyltriglutamate--homocysteine S-methyltransferase [Elizabethkingia anophelis]AIL44816.1 5-methyltetrahydropteroyltriglutamate--homocysteine methyltransferase [Elizabethkingia anophelis NUHP1]MBE9393276.1 5-methyltetrahydropteroyltriglutamate--homocysteine S-methyltransferase [Elizabethkingia anophelis]MBE9406124.1 5-methyltetrahydropteroyltriglutamate--homocysteine S-methyltransferase [Elizabethkingia anophelis]MCT3832276.1 5-methyltetrahydropteroyltriglutamate--homocys